MFWYLICKILLSILDATQTQSVIFGLMIGMRGHMFVACTKYQHYHLTMRARKTGEDLDIILVLMVSITNYL